MLIDGNSINGIFLYTEDSSQVEFEKNDFVVSGDCIYICTAENPTNPVNNTVSGIDPKNDIRHENFKPYPGSMISSAQDFFDYVESGGEGEDKYVSSRSLVGILQKFQFGLSMTGVIEDYIGSTGDCSLDLDKISENPLNNLMLTEDLNNGVIRVSPLLSYLQDDTIFSTMFGYLDLESISSDEYSLLLRQYTYKTSNTQFARIQELISPVAGLTYYRVMYWTLGDGFPVDDQKVSPWRNTYTYQTTLKDRLEVLQEFYQNSAERFREKMISLRGSFRFREANLVEESSSDIYQRYYSWTDFDPGKLTLLIQEAEGHSRQESIVLSLEHRSTSKTYYLSSIEDSYIELSISQNGLGKWVASFTVYNNSGSCKIEDAYYREYYE